MEQTAAPQGRHGTSYNIFILVLTVLSLVIMVWMVLPISEEALALLQVYDNLICLIFLFDFFSSLSRSPRKSDYFIRDRGWLDLLGSIPSFGLLKYSALLRLARLSRLARIMRLLRGKNREALIKDVIQNRGSYALFLTVLLTILVLSIASVLVLQFESRSPDANIHTGGDALWYAVVTITTVGYGDRYPVTTLGRLTAFFLMFMGVGIIGALASILSSILVGSPSSSEEQPPSEASVSNVDEELATIKNELSALRQLLESRQSDGDQQ